VRGHDVRIEGLRFRGPSNGSRSRNLPGVSGIDVYVDAALGTGRNVVVTGSEFWYWTAAAVGILNYAGPSHMTRDQAGLISATRNYIHQNARDGLGYGITVGGHVYALIEGNLFDRNRHAVAANGQPSSGYLARHNYVLAGGYTEDGTCNYWNQHFDVHGSEDDGYGGPAGEYFEISSNTIRGEQGYCIWKTRPAFMLRGRPTLGAYFIDNVAVHNDLDAAVALKWDSGDTGYGEDHAQFNFHAWGNAFDRDLSLEVAVAGDLDGDGLDDLFLANGTGWWYSSAGRTEWRFLQASPLRLSSLRFGRFDSDARADVFTHEGNTWKYSPGGVGPLVRLRDATAAPSDLLFGDFDGNGVTDVIWTTGSSWYLSRDSRVAWEYLKPSGKKAADLRVGDFDGNGADDVLGHVNGAWYTWRYGITRLEWEWELLNSALSSSMSSLVVADFDGDSRDDVAQTSGSGWRYSSGAASGWLGLPGAGDLPVPYRDIRLALVGRFNEDNMADALRFEMQWTGSIWAVPNLAALVGWDGIQAGFRAWTWPGIFMR